MEGESVRHILIAVGNPRANGRVEHFNQVFTPILVKLCDMPEKWDRIMRDVEFDLNNTRCRSTGDSPGDYYLKRISLGSINDEIYILLDSYSNDNKDLTAIRNSAVNVGSDPTRRTKKN